MAHILTPLETESALNYFPFLCETTVFLFFDASSRDFYGFDRSKMAHYGYNSYDSNICEYHWTPYSTSYDVVPYQPPFTCYSSEFDEPKFIDYYPNTNGNRYDPSHVEINYSMYSFSEPKLIEYDASSYLSPQTQYLISYSTSQFNEPDFVEYDPTPYEVGYDIVLTYGKPLPPSDDICYPRSTEVSNGLSIDSFSYGSIPSPYGNEGGNDDSSEKPIIPSKPIDFNEDGSKSDVKAEDQLSTGDENGNGNCDGGDLVGPIEDSNHDEEREGYTYTNYDYEYPWSGYDYDYDYGCGNGRSGWCEEECQKGVPQTTYGYGSDTVELCESLFGYWPCLSKKNPRMDGNNQGFGSEGSNSNPWKGTADYIFGSPVGYGEGRYCISSSHGLGSYDYQQQPYYVQE